MIYHRVIIASAGSRKTTLLIEEALSNPQKRILILTYTIENEKQINRYFFNICGVVPSNVTVQSWLSFLLTECVRPYQNFVYEDCRIESLHFSTPEDINWLKVNMISKKNNPKTYFIKGKKYIYSHNISEFVTLCQERSKGKIVSRLEGIYDCIYIDEIQDYAGHDLELFRALYKSKIETLFVGDIRQIVYSTNYASLKNKQYRKECIYDFFMEYHNKNICEVIVRNECYRSNQTICDFADNLNPHLPKTISKMLVTTTHDGIFIIKSHNIHDYMLLFGTDIMILRWDKNVDTYGYASINFGMSKGQNYKRVLIIPTAPIKKYLRTGNLEHAGDKHKLYVAITRAMHSVTFVYDGVCGINTISEYVPILDP